MDNFRNGRTDDENVLFDYNDGGMPIFPHEEYDDKGFIEEEFVYLFSILAIVMILAKQRYCEITTSEHYRPWVNMYCSRTTDGQHAHFP